MCVCVCAFVCASTLFCGAWPCFYCVQQAWAVGLFVCCAVDCECPTACVFLSPRHLSSYLYSSPLSPHLLLNPFLRPSSYLYRLFSSPSSQAVDVRGVQQGRRPRSPAALLRACACMHACLCMCACVHVCMCACVHVCMCACVHVCTLLIIQSLDSPKTSRQLTPDPATTLRQTL